MARLDVSETEIRVRLSRWERLGALRGDLRVPRTVVRNVRVATVPLSEAQGLRVPGTGVPGVIALGSWRRHGGKEFLAVYRRKPAVVVELGENPAGYRRVVVSTDAPEQLVARLQAAHG